MTDLVNASPGHDSVPDIEGIDLQELASYGQGTLIDTPQGERPIEALRLGERVLTVGGEALPIEWIGRRSYSGWSMLDNREIAPVCVRANAIADHVPKRDLWVSPCHGLLIDAVLIPAQLLVNGISIVRSDAVWEIQYHHIELERHAVILAENAPTETSVDEVAGAPQCAPRLSAGNHLDLIREQLQRRARLLQFSEHPQTWHDSDSYANRATDTIVSRILGLDPPK